MSKILYRSKNALIVYKSAGIPSQKDNSQDRDLMSEIKEELSLLGESEELYIVHRLDRVVGGLLAFARNKKFAAALSELAASGDMEKEYLAVIEGVPDRGEGIMSDFIRKDAILSKAFVSDSQKSGAKKAELEYFLLDSKETDKGIRSLVKIKLKTGRFHQIRAQFSSRKMPLVGDKKYGSRDIGSKMPSLFAHKLSFSVLGEEGSARLIPDLYSYPWNIFDEVIYKNQL